MSNLKKIQAVVDRMRSIFVGSGLKAVSRDTVEKWAKEIESALKEKP